MSLALLHNHSLLCLSPTHYFIKGQYLTSLKYMQLIIDIWEELLTSCEKFRDVQIELAVSD